MADPRDVENLRNQEPDEILVDGHPELSEPRPSSKKAPKPAPKRRPGTKADRERTAAARTERKDSDPIRTREVPRGEARSPRWWAPLMVTLMVVGLLFVVVYYLFGGRGPIPSIGNANLFIGFGVMIVGFLMTMGWK